MKSWASTNNLFVRAIHSTSAQEDMRNRSCSLAQLERFATSQMGSASWKMKRHTPVALSNRMDAFVHDEIDFHFIRYKVCATFVGYLVRFRKCSFILYVM